MLWAVHRAGSAGARREGRALCEIRRSDTSVPPTPCDAHPIRGSASVLWTGAALPTPGLAPILTALPPAGPARSDGVCPAPGVRAGHASGTGAGRTVSGHAPKNRAPRLAAAAFSGTPSRTALPVSTVSEPTRMPERT
ncbi:hypothetical protein NGM37_22555, partial [Streptomyces sp. TRM76130]|nr:hypothetical protein [Streptomyces sp. TRM76130]